MFKALKDMLGSFVRKPGAPVFFHTGGVFKGGPGLRTDEVPAILKMGDPWPFPSHKLYEENPLGRGEAFDLRQRRKPSFHVQISLPKSRKRPITDDMAQMCQDLGIEPSMSYEDFRKSLEKTIAASMGLTFEQLCGQWAR